MDGQLTGSRHFQLEQLAAGVYAAIHRPGGTAISNAGIIDLGDRTLVFDSLFTPQAAQDLRRAAEQLTGRPVTAVINSHCHNDHIWGNQAFDAGTDIIASSAARRVIQADAAAGAYDGMLASAESRLAAALARLQAAGDGEQPHRLSEWVDYQQAVVDLKPVLRVRLPNLTFTGRLAFHGSQRTAELIAFAGGHCNSNAVLWLPQERIAFMSDLLFTCNHPYLGDGDPTSLLRILQDVAAWQPLLLVPGHGPVGTPESIDLMRRYVTLVDGLARCMVENGEAEDAIDNIAIPPPFEAWGVSSFFAANLSSLRRRHLRKHRKAAA